MKFFRQIFLIVFFATPSKAARLPFFSWDTVPVYEMFGSGDRLLTSDEVRHIAANTNFLCIEKNHAVRLLGGADHGAAREFARFKKINPDSTCLFYFNSAYAYPFTSRSKVFRFGQVSPKYEGFLIRDPKNRELVSRGTVHYFDVLNPEFREWWAGEVGRYVKETGADGLFVDQMHGFGFLRPHLQSEVRKAQAGMMEMARKALGPDKVLLLNNGAHIPELFEIGNSFMFEHYSKEKVTKEAIIEDWKLMEKIAEAGKSSVWRIGVEVEGAVGGERQSAAEYRKLAKRRLSFFLAAFLAGACEHSYFQYGWGWRLDTGPLMHYPEFDRPLGKPLGKRRRPDPERWVFTRKFEHAEVRVDFEARQGSIIWKVIHPPE